MTAKMKNALVGSMGLFAIAMAFTLFAIPQVSYAGQAVDESDAWLRLMRPGVTGSKTNRATGCTMTRKATCMRAG